MHARYTVVLRDIMTNDFSKDALAAALSNYPLYSNPKSYDLIPTREQLNTKLLNHYKYREIGFETVGRFLDELDITMCEIMPRYNELFKTIVTMAELPSPFDNVDIVETYEEQRTHSSESSGSSTNSQTGSGTQNGESTSDVNGSSSESGENTANQTANGKHIESDTPQDSLSIGSDGINDVDYASKAQWNEDKLNSESSSEVSRTNTEKVTGTTKNTTASTNEETGSSTATNASSDTVSHTVTKKGNQGVNTYAHDMNEFRTSIIDVVEQIINDDRIAELFMMVY